MNTLYKFGLWVFLIQTIVSVITYPMLDGMGRFIVILLYVFNFFQLVKLREVTRSGNGHFM